MTCWPAGVLVSAAGMTTVSDVPPRCHAGPDGVLTPATPGTAFSDLTAPPGSAPPGSDHLDGGEHTGGDPGSLQRHEAPVRRAAVCERCRRWVTDAQAGRRRQCPEH